MSFTGKEFRDEGKLKDFSNIKLPESKISNEFLSEVPKKILKSNSASYLRSKSPNSSRNLRSLEEDELSEIAIWRRATKEDKSAIKQLQILTGNVANLMYRKPSITELIEKSLFPIVQLDSRGELVSFTAFDSYPNVPSVPSFFWSDWLNTNYRIQGASSRNVLFIHYMVWQPDQLNRFLFLLLETTFTEFLHLKHIIMVKPPNVQVPDFYEKYFIPVLPMGLKKHEFDSMQSLLVCLRTSVIHRLPIRTAFKEELEIIMSIVNSHTDNSKGMNDPPYVLDFINFAYQYDKKTLIYEFEGDIAGVMILNLAIDLDLLERGFELAPFHGLRKRDIEDDGTLKNDIKPIQAPKVSSFQFSEQPNLLISSEFLLKKVEIEMMIKKIKQNEAPVFYDEVTNSFSTSSDFPDLSLVRLLSGSDQYKSQTETEIQTQKLSSTVESDASSELNDLKIAMRGSLKGSSHFYVPKYHGHLNAFIIDFFAIDCSKVDEKLSSFDFLEAAFKAVPDRDYCILIIPSDFLPSPILDLFVRVTPQPMAGFKQELYICHKNSLSSATMIVKTTEKEDLIAVNDFLKCVEDSERIYEDISKNCLVGNEFFKSFLFFAEGHIIGISLLDCVDDVEDFQFYFDLNDFTDIQLHKIENQSVIKYLILNPIYHNHARFFIRDVMRLANLTCLYYVTGGHEKENFNFTTALEELVPIKPKKKAGMDELFPQFRTFTERKYKLPIGLYSISTRLCGFRKLHLNIIIVVVGASRTALSFLESIIFGQSCSHITYNNLICVTPHPLISEGAQGELKSLMFPFKDNFSKKYRSMLSLETYVSFIYGVMTGINRNEKFIVVNNEAIVPYNYLVLTCGLQYLMPIPLARKSPKNRHGKNVTGLISRFLHAGDSKKILRQPKNIFIINSTSDADSALHGLQQLMKKLKNMADKKIIVYGHNLHVFLIMHTLLKLGIPGELILFVEPPFQSSSEKITVFNDHRVDQAVIDSIKNCRVNYFTEYSLHDWVLNSDGYVTSVIFHSRMRQITVPCIAFFPFVQKLVSNVTFNACNSAGLVYDGKLVINHNFRTNDKYIYAAGSFTKYARRYYASDQDHRFFNSIEVGQKLAKIIQTVINPLEKAESEEKSGEVVPQLKAPLLLHCQLPGDFNLLVVRKPGKMLDLETAYNFYDYGEVLTTGDCEATEGNGYFRLHLGPEGFVETIICYSRNKIDYVNLSSLYGLHERLLNNLLYRYDLSLIPDFFAYFRQPWALALFHKNFEFLREWNHKVFHHKLFKNGEESFSDKIVKVLEESQGNSVKIDLHLKVSESVRRDLEEEYLKLSLGEEVKINVVQFLEYFKKDLPVYAIPSAVRHMLHKGLDHDSYNF